MNDARVPLEDASPNGRVAASSPTDRKRPIARLVRRGLLVLLALALLFAVVAAFLPKPVDVDLARVGRGELQVTIDEDGRTRVRDRYVVSAPIAANLVRIELSAGDAVQPGQVLARLSPLSAPLLDTRSRAEARARVEAARAAREQARASVERSRTALDFAERETERQVRLERSGAASARAREQAELEARTRREELASVEFGTRVAEHELEQAQAALERTTRGVAPLEQLTLTAPVAGRVLKVLQESEGAVQPGTPLLELGDPSALEIVVDVLTADAVRIASAMPVRIEHWGGEQALQGHVRRVEPSAFTRISALGVEEQRVNVLVDLDDPRERRASLGDGYRVEARIITWQGTGVLTVPASALFRHERDWAVFQVSDGKARLKRVRVGHRNPEQVELVSGLQQGDTIVVHPSDRVRDGVVVAAR